MDNYIVNIVAFNCLLSSDFKAKKKNSTIGTQLIYIKDKDRIKRGKFNFKKRMFNKYHV